METVAVVVAVSRPERISSIVSHFAGQYYPDRQLLLCLNGAAQHASISSSERIAVLRGEGGTPARPRNMGLEAAREARYALVAFWDDDDYYGPGYLSELVLALDGNRRRVVGKYARFTRYDDGLFHLRGAQASFLGGTISAWVEDLPPIPDLSRDEDMVWCKELALAGYELSPLSDRHFVYNRMSGHHAWYSTKLQMFYSYGPACEFGDAPDSIVDGHFDLASKKIIPKPSDREIEEELLFNLSRREIIELESTHETH